MDRRSTKEPSPTNPPFAQSIQPRAQCGGEEIDLFTVRAARAQGGSQVFVRQAIRDWRTNHRDIGPQ